MKNITELKKEIEELEVKADKEEKRDIYSGELVRIYGKIDKLKAQLKTLQEVCKEIKKVILNIGAEQSDKHLQGMEIFEKELLNKLKGDEK